MDEDALSGVCTVCQVRSNKRRGCSQDPTRLSEKNCIKDLAPRQKLPLDSTLELSPATPVGLSSGFHCHCFQSFHQNNDDHDNNVHSVCIIIVFKVFIKIKIMLILCAGEYLNGSDLLGVSRYYCPTITSSPSTSSSHHHHHHMSRGGTVRL